MFTGSKDRACDRERREDHGKRQVRNHSGSRRDEHRGHGGDNGGCGQVQVIMVDDIKPHIIGITESWAHSDIIYAEMGMEGYVKVVKVVFI